LPSTKGQRLRKARQNGRLTQQVLAERLGVSQPLVWQWETDKSPFDKYRKQIEEILGPLTNKKYEAVPAVAAEEGSEFGDWVRDKRNQAGWSVPELAKKADISAAAIYNIENGKIKNPQSATKDKLAKAFDEKVPQDILEATEQEQKIEGLGSLTDFDPYEQKLWPTCAGIYVLYDNTERPVYVGKPQRIADRLKIHEKQKFWIVPLVTYASYIEVNNEKTRHQLEQVLIKFLKSNAVLNKQSVESFEEE
jgi:transcriptional regulator with XRE-family HTH domain